MFIDINGQPFNIPKINTISPKVLSPNEVKQSFDYNSSAFKPTYGFVIEMDSRDYQIGFDTKEEAEAIHKKVKQKLLNIKK